MLGIQLLGIFYALFMMYLTFLHYQRREYSKNVSIAWFIVWFSLLGISIYPSALENLSTGLFGAYRTLDLLVIATLFGILGLTYRNYVELKRQKKKIELLVMLGAQK